MKEKSRRAREEIGLWLGRIKASKTHFNQLLRERDEYERALALIDGTRSWTGGSIQDAMAADALFKQQSVPLSFRYAVWLQAQTAGDTPVIKYPRGANGDEQFALTLEELLLRVWAESGAQKEWAQAIFDLCAFGSCCIWYGFHAEIITAEEAEAASEAVEDTVSRALRGDTEPAEGQDNALAAAALDAALKDPVNRLALPAPTQMALAQAATEQEMAAVEAEKEPGTPRVRSRSIWSKRLKIGKDVIWDHTVNDLKDARWIARLVRLSLREAKEFDGFSGGARSRIAEDKLVALDANDVELVRETDDKPANSVENGRFLFWEVWDKAARTVHYISEAMPEYLEASEDYPYRDNQTGEPAIPGFFPCSISAPLRHGMAVPSRTTGIPLIAPGYPIQRDIVKLHDFAIESAKRHSKRVYEYPEGMDEDTLAAYIEAPDAGLVPRPAGTNPGETLVPIQFTGEAYRIVDLINRLTAEWAMVQGFPLADLTSQPQAKTATAEQLSVESGRFQADFVIQAISDDMAHGVEVLRAMLKIGLYPPEKIASLMGPGSEQVMAAWQATSLDGDKIGFKLASRAKADQVVRIKQLQEAAVLAQGFADPVTGLPKYDATPFIEAMFMALEVGRPKPLVWDQRTLMMRQLFQGAGLGGAGGPGGGPDKREQEAGPPTRASQNTAARRP